MQSDTSVPTIIRPHLVPFLFQEMEGVSAAIDFQRVNMVHLFPTSSLANYLYTQINDVEKTKFGIPRNKFLLYLSIEKKTKFTLSGTIYINKKGVKEILHMDIKKVRAVNNLFEDMFRTSLVFYVEGYVAAGLEIIKGLDLFAEKYNLLEYGFTTELLRSIYYSQKKKKLLNRFQTKSSNRVLNFL